MFKVLLIEDEIKVHHIIKQYFIKNNYDIMTAATGQEGIDLFDSYGPDIVILDLMLPDRTGESICKYIRDRSNCPVIMLTAKSSEEDRIIGLELGADDYLVKPFSPKELVLRVNAIIKRVYRIHTETRHISCDSGRIKIYTSETRVLVEEKDVHITPIEYKLLNLFIKHPQQVFSREQLIEHALGLEFDGYDRTIDAHIKNLRKKIEVTPKTPTMIKTVFGLGYRWEGVIDG